MACAITNTFCQTQASIAAILPSTQLLPDNTVVDNPFFQSESNQSFWSYKLLLNCALVPRQPLNFYIPIYENISEDMVTVQERRLRCTEFNTVEFTFGNPPGITPPTGFKFINIAIDGRYGEGTCVLYRLQVTGNFPETNESVYLNTNSGLLTYDPNYLVPGIPLVSSVTITKTNNVAINGQQATITSNITVTNTGNVDLSNLLFTDLISYDGANITLGNSTVTPDDFTISQPSSGVLRFQGTIAQLAMGESFTIEENIVLAKFSTPNSYTINSVASVMSDSAQDTTNTMVTIPVVSYTTSTLCTVGEDNFVVLDTSLTAVGNSPEDTVQTTALLVIPETVLISILNFDGCTFTFVDTGEPVQVNEPINGRSIQIQCQATIPTNATMTFSFLISIIASNVLPTVTNQVLYTLQEVTLKEANSSVFLGATPLPNRRSFSVNVTETCSNNCTQ